VAKHAIADGSTWVLLRGVHKGALVSVERTSGVSVFFHEQGGGASKGNQKVDPSKVHTLSRELFLARYAPEGALVSNGTPATSFRKRSAPKPKETESGVPLPALQPGEIHMQVVDVTPLQAQVWLDNGGANRRLKKRTVERYAAFMRRGEWRMTAEPIKLDAQASVRDGQHRLAAIVQSGMTVPLLVVRGVDEEAFDVMDTGKARTPADVLSIHGYHTTVGMAAVIRNLLLIERQGHVNASTDEMRALYSGPTVLAYAQQHPEIEETYALAQTLAAAGLQGGPGTWGAALTLFWRIDQDATREMVRYLQTGAGMQAGHPLLALRNRAVNRDARLYTRTPEGRQELLGMIIKAWNAWRAGESVSRLTWRPREPSLPEIDGAPARPLKQIRIPSLEQAE
jgi:hypothetical protein